MLCSKCHSNNNETDYFDERNCKTEPKVIILPKENIYNINFSEKSEAERALVENNNNKEDIAISHKKAKSSNINNPKNILNENNINFINNNENNINKINNSKKINDNNNYINNTKNINNDNKTNNNNKGYQFKKSNLFKDYCKKIKSKNKNDINLEGSLSSKFLCFQDIDSSFESKKEEDDNNNDYKNEKGLGLKSIFSRRNKRSRSLTHNSIILKKLKSIQINVPLPHELLVIKKKGDPKSKYIRGKKLGKGTFGFVYESINKIFNNKVAMKIIQKDYNMDDTLIKNEIDILKKLSHPNIVRIYEFYESNINFYLINEFCPEGELYNYINNSTLNEQQLAVIFYQVFSGLKYMHENNILHRDLKPENILISKKETDLLDGNEYFWIQIIDFGTAKIFENDKKENLVVGSPYYIAPEVLNKDYNEKCDTWSVGVILYMFLVGKPPFNGKTNDEIVNSIQTSNYDENNPKLITHSEEVQNLIKHLLDKDINKRFSAKEALNHEWFKKFNGRKLFENFEEKDIQHYIDNLFNYTINSKIQQLVIAFLVHNLPHTESSLIILKFYRYFNTAGDCKLSKDELKEGLCKYREKEEVDKNLEQLFKLLDGDKDGYIEYEEFLRACIDKKDILNDEYLQYAFKFLDTDNKHLLSAQQINSAFFSKENKVLELAITKDILEMDEDGDEMIDFEEFKKFMLKTMK